MSKNFALITLIFSLLGILILIGYFFEPWKYLSKNVGKNFVTVGKHEIAVDIADTPAKRAKGLMGVKEMPKNKGMLFIFDKPGTQKFWMANTHIPLDIIWLNASKEVIYIEHNTPPCTETGQLQALCKTYGPDELAKYVLELNGGMANEYDIKAGDTIDF